VCALYDPYDPPDYFYDLDTIKDVLEDEDLYDRIVHQNNILLEAEGESAYLYQRKTSGDPCPAPHDTTGDAQISERCELCYGTGYLGGYDLYGYITQVLEATGANSAIALQLSGLSVQIGTRRNWVEIADSLTGGTVETDWIDASNAEEFVQIKTLSAGREGDASVEYRFYGQDWKPAALFSAEDPAAISDKRFKIRVSLSRLLSTADSPEWYHTKVRWRSSTRYQIKVLTDSERGRLRWDQFGFVYEETPPTWTSPSPPAIGQRDLLEFTYGRFLVTDVKKVGVGPLDRELMQQLVLAQVEAGHPYDDVF